MKTWLADESVMVHFESIKFETNGTVSLGIDNLFASDK